MDSAVSPGTALTDRSESRSTVLSGRTLIAIRTTWLLITASAVSFSLAKPASLRPEHARFHRSAPACS